MPTAEESDSREHIERYPVRSVLVIAVAGVFLGMTDLPVIPTFAEILRSAFGAENSLGSPS